MTGLSESKAFVAKKSLESLRDIEGVSGSFLLNPQGEVLSRDLPSMVRDDALQSAGPRISRIWNALPQGDSPDFLTIEFESHRLHALCFSNYSLCVWALPRVNLLALKMATLVAAERLDHSVFEDQQAETPLAATPPSSRTCVYRGVRYESNSG